MSDSSLLIRQIAAGADDAPAILAPDRAPLTHGALRRQMAETGNQLRQFGIGRRDRVAIVLPNGPEMATAFVSIAAAAATAPLNPAYRADELEFYLSDIGARAIVVTENETGPAIGVAGKLGIAIIELGVSLDWPAGQFSLACRALSSPPAALDGPDDIALLLHTSGTTSRPKLVPLSHANLAASARHIGATLGLEPADRCLNIMPLFHIHGLIARRPVHRSPPAAASSARRDSTHCASSLAERDQADLVHRRSHHASGDPRPRRAQSGSGGGISPALRPLVLSVIAGTGHART